MTMEDVSVVLWAGRGYSGEYLRAGKANRCEVDGLKRCGERDESGGEEEVEGGGSHVEEC